MFIFFIALVVLAALPGPGILVVIAKTLSHGFYAGCVTAMGIVAGDFVFIVLAIYGLSSLTNLMGDFFILVNYIGALYLIWLGIKIIHSKTDSQASLINSKKSLPSTSMIMNFMTGLVVTLSNPKAILFYISFLPGFFDLSAMKIVDVIAMLLVALIAVGGVMLSYVYLAAKTNSMLQTSSNMIKYSAGLMVISSGIYIGLKN